MIPIDTPKILVVGSMNMDLCMYQTDGLPHIGASTFCRSYQYAEGGKGANQAYAVARQGGDAVMVGRIGQHDENGEKLLRSLESAGVNTGHVIRDAVLPTGMSIMCLLQDGKYFSVYAKGANDALTPEDVETALDSGRFDMVLMQLEMPLETAFRCFELAKNRNIPVFLDAGPAMHISLERMKGLFIISPNEAETEALTGIPVTSDQGAEEAVKKLYQLVQPHYVLMKAGERGALLYAGEDFVWFPAFHVDAIDTTAAGDTFSATFAVQYCCGKSMEEAINIAQAAAAICITREGGQPSIPSRKETEEFYYCHAGNLERKEI